ncbi:hypothetical protein [Nocardioides koreensis]
MALTVGCAPVASETLASDGSRPGRSAISKSAAADPAADPAGAYTPFVYEPEFPGEINSHLATGCRDEILAAGHDPAADWVLVLSNRNTLRRQVIARRDDEAVRVECRLQDVILPRNVPEPIATDDSGILLQCGSVAGHDFTGWSVLTSMAAAQGVEAVLASTNGYTAYCSLQPPGWDSGSGQVVDLPVLSDVQLGRRQSGDGHDLVGERSFNGSSLSIKTAHTPIAGQLWHGSGTLYDERGQIATDARRIVFTFADTGERFVVPVVRGRWAARIHRPDATRALGQYRAVIADRAGGLLSEYTSPP